MKIIVDRGRCTGIGICESVSPDYFEVGDDGVLIQTREFVAPEDRDEVSEAVLSCPAAALSLAED
ncbi:ferredoxin [Microbacterium aquimaris]|uniref:ferredoxin n=1 Tax=Microbacterium aquimaris TaxID=459816 RepID=UPI002AD54BB3|nr:ferredoxin [Microbacterium aquimaris]MDZ8275050.1 ferredoxin [Microbacterium aquimaris]